MNTDTNEESLFVPQQLQRRKPNYLRDYVTESQSIFMSTQTFRTFVRFTCSFTFSLIIFLGIFCFLYVTIITTIIYFLEEVSLSLLDGGFCIQNDLYYKLRKFWS